MQASRSAGKSASAFRTISEVSEELDVPPHVLRFWEGKFSQVRPLKRGGGRRYYRPEDIALLRRIRDLLYSEGYTIKGVQKLLREGRVKDDGQAGEPVASEAPVPAAAAGDDRDRTREIEEVIAELTELSALLKGARKKAG